MVEVFHTLGVEAARAVIIRELQIITAAFSRVFFTIESAGTVSRLTPGIFVSLLTESRSPVSGSDRKVMTQQGFVVLNDADSLGTWFR